MEEKKIEVIQRKHHHFKYLFFLIIAALLYFAMVKSPYVRQFTENPELLKTIILGFGILAPLAVIFLQFFQTAISIFPSQITTIVAGFVFGPFLGLVYSLIGAFLGSMLVFVLAKKYGKRLASKLFEKHDLVHFNLLFKEKKLKALFLARVTPLFPNDVVSFGAGLTGMRLRNFNLVSTSGFIIQMLILTYFGSELATGKLSWNLVFISIIISLFFLIALFNKQIKRLIIRDWHKIEKEGKVLKYLVEKEFSKI